MRMEKTGRKERFLIAGLAVGIIMFNDYIPSSATVL